MRSTRSFADASPARALATAGLLVAIGAVLGLVESTLLPALPVPGIRLGIANVAVVLALALVGPRKALAVSILRVVVVGIAAGSLGGPAGILAVSGAICAWAAMALLSRRPAVFSVVGWSVAGAAAHVLGQLAVACLITGSAAPLLFAPLSLAASLGCGLAIGYSARLLLSRLPLALAMEAAGRLGVVGVAPRMLARRDALRDVVLCGRAESLSDAALVGVLVAECSEDAGRVVLDAHPIPDSFWRLNAEDLMRLPGVGPAGAARLLACLEMSRRASAWPASTRPTVSTASDVAAICATQMRGLDREHFWALALNTKNQLLRMVEISVGSLNASIVHPREL
jgi:heptaprenyl diphosphate synthase